MTKPLARFTKELLALVVLVAAGCSYIFEITAEDLQTLSPRFKVHSTTAFSLFPSQPELMQIQVYDPSAEDITAQVIWRITADPPLPLVEIVYGSDPEGFVTEVAPQTLRPGVKYHLSALAFGGSGGIDFEVRPNLVTGGEP
jgi:hypothetical protein